MTINAKLVGLFFVFLLLLACLAPVKQDISSFLSGFIFILLTYIVFFLGTVAVKRKKSVIVTAGLNSLNDNIKLVFSFFTIFLAIYAIKVYTGKGGGEVVSTILLGASNYNEYQQYFRDNQLGSFSFTKLGGIISLFLVKLNLLFTIIDFSLQKPNAKRVVALFFSFIAMIYVSIGRGTSFEIFELLLMIIFFTYTHFILSRKRVSLKSIFILVILLLIGLIFYSNGINARYSGEYTLGTSNELFYDETKGIAGYKFISIILFQLGNYFLIAPLYLSEFLNRIFLDFESFIIFLLPGAGNIAGIKPEFLCEYQFNCGVAWTPSVENVLMKLGFILYFIFIYSLGYIDSKISHALSVKPEFISLIMQYYIFLGLISLPVGNFIGNSSANILILGIVVLFKLNKLR